MWESHPNPVMFSYHTKQKLPRMEMYGKTNPLQNKLNNVDGVEECYTIRKYELHVCVGKAFTNLSDLNRIKKEIERIINEFLN